MNLATVLDIYQSTEDVFKEKRRVWDPMLKLTIISPYIIVDSKVKLSTPTIRNVSPIIQKKKYEEGEEKGWELTLCLRIDIYGAWAGQPHALVEVNLTP
jgi:hypothetical protein